MNEAKVNQFLEYFSIVPGLSDFFLEHKDIQNMKVVIDMFRSECVDNGLMTDRLDLMIKILMEMYEEIREKSDFGMHYINKSIQVDDSELLQQFAEDTKGLFKEGWAFKNAVHQHYKTITEKIAYKEVDYSSIIDKYIDCDHPYVCSQIAVAYLNAKIYDIGLVFLQKALTHVFSYPNIYWHNPRALYGCVDALFEFQFLLGRDGMDSLDAKIKGGTSKILKCLYLYLSRAISMGDSEPENYDPEKIPLTKAAKLDYLCNRANLVYDYRDQFAYLFSIGVNPDIQYLSDKATAYYISLEYGLGAIYLDSFNDALKMYRYGSLIPNGSGGYVEIEDATFGELIQRGQLRADSYAQSLYEEYSNGEYYISRSDIADCIAYVKERLVEHTSLSFTEFLDKRSEAWLKAWKEVVEAGCQAATLETERLRASVEQRKPEADAIAAYLERNGVQYFYHFTDRQNLESIIKKGGLYSWKYSLDNSIAIACPGGDQLSRQLDQRFGLEDYVRLSFCDDHPMSWRLKQLGSDLVLLKIKKDVALFSDTLFSDINAADGGHNHGRAFRDLQYVDIRATKRHHVRKDDPDFKKHQAEVIVKTFIPLEYIVNINNPESL